MTMMTDNQMTEQPIGDGLEDARRAMVGEAPKMPKAVPTTFDLKVGLTDPSGEQHTEAEAKELTGVDEEILGKSKNEQDFFATVVALGIVRIGTEDLTKLENLTARKALLGRLPMGDRDRCFLEVARVTFGDEKEITFSCTTCGEKQEATLLLSEDFPQKEVSDDREFTTSSGQRITYRLVTGNDSDSVSEVPNITTAQGNTMILSRCITKVDDQILPDPEGFAKSLSMRDRQKLMEQMNEGQPSIDMVLHTVCAACEGSVPLSVSWGAIFRP